MKLNEAERYKRLNEIERELKLEITPSRWSNYIKLLTEKAELTNQVTEPTNAKR